MSDYDPYFYDYESEEYAQEYQEAFEEARANEDMQRQWEEEMFRKEQGNGDKG
jgi:hypothetical protein